MQNLAEGKKEHKTQVGESLSLGYFSSFIFTPPIQDLWLIQISTWPLWVLIQSQPSRVWGSPVTH